MSFTSLPPIYLAEHRAFRKLIFHVFTKNNWALIANALLVILFYHTGKSNIVVQKHGKFSS